jgi:hypothetical protein
MFTILKKLLGVGVPKARKAAAGFRPDLEALESRDLMSVAGYSAVGQTDFFIDPATSTLNERNQYGSGHSLTASASQVSVLQGDGQAPNASARADVLLLNGDLKQWDDAAGWTFIASGVKQVSAGWDGNSAVLFSNGNLSLYNADTSAWTNGLGSNIASASIGLGHQGLTMVGMVTTSGAGVEWRAAGRESLGAAVKLITAGSDGHCMVLRTDGSLWDHYDASYTSSGAYTGLGTLTAVTSPGAVNGTVSVSCGLDIQGGAVLVVVDCFGDAYERTGSNNWKEIAEHVGEADAGSAGAIELVSSYGSLYLRDYWDAFVSSGASIGRYNDNGGSIYPDTFTALIASNNRNFLG